LQQGYALSPVEAKVLAHRLQQLVDEQTGYTRSLGKIIGRLAILVVVLLGLVNIPVTRYGVSLKVTVWTVKFLGRRAHAGPDVARVMVGMSIGSILASSSDSR
jgi:hypothetical protein